MRLKSILLLLFSVLTLKIAAQNTITESQLCTTYRRIVQLRMDGGINSEDQKRALNQTFRKQFIQYLKSNPKTLISNQDSLKKLDIKISSSEDQQFRIYSWDTWLGGSMHKYENIFQYKAGEIVYLVADTGFKANTIYSPYYSQIFTVKAEKKTYYLGVNNGVYSGKDASQSLKAFRIDGDKLNDTLPLFKSKKKFNTIYLEFDFFSALNHTERPIQLFRFSPDLLLISFPIIDKEKRLTELYKHYQFNGKFFIEKSGNSIHYKKEKKQK